MDPKQNTGASGQPLDPKLQEAYDRVMGVNLTGDATNPQAPAPTPAEPSAPAVTPTPNPVPPVVPTTPPVVLPSDVVDTPPTPPVNPATDVPPAMPPMPPMSEPSMPIAPIPDNPVMPPIPQPTPSTPPMDTMSATMTMPHHDSETVKIGLGGSPVAATKAKGKGISPVILIFGAIAFLVVYAIFWVKFFGLSVPFITQ